MDGFIQITIIILGSGMISAFVWQKFGLKKISGSIITTGLLFSVLYYYMTGSIRMLSGQGHSFFGDSFAGKTLRSYIKVGVLEIILFIGVFILLKWVGERFQRFLERFTGIFTALWLLYAAWVGIPVLYTVFVLGVMAAAAAFLCTLFEKKSPVLFLEKERWSRKQKCQIMVSSLLMFTVTLFLAGPTEIYAYNSGDFAFTYQSFIWYLLLFSAGLILIGVVLCRQYLKGILFDITWLGIAAYTIAVYLQTMFFNGKMDTINGLQQTWGGTKVVFNTLFWCIIILTVFAIGFKMKKADKIFRYIALYLTAVQVIATVFTLITTNVAAGKSSQLVVDDMFTLSEKDNVIVFVLDAYDVQMMKMVMEDDPGFLDPLQDFTYYSNMDSRFYATDGSLPYLLTGVKLDTAKQGTEEYTKELYAKGNFLKDIKAHNYDIRLLTETKYVEPFPENDVDNYVDSFYCYLDYDKTVSQMSDCARYRGTPFLLKKYYQFEDYDITNLRKDTDLYLFGTDSEFYSTLCEEKLQTNPSMEGTFRMYHLFGAHCPYYLTEDVQLDYSSGNPMAQWRGCLKIVYEYLQQLKEQGLYDSATIIVTADHGLNNTQRTALKALDIEVSEESNPIFFLKRSGEIHDAMQYNDEKTSHDDFFSTIIKSIDKSDNSYGKAIWE